MWLCTGFPVLARQDQLKQSPKRTALRTLMLPALLVSISHNAQLVGHTGTANAFGDDQLNVDISAEKLVRRALASCPSVVTASSEEDPTERSADGRGQPEQYTVAFDPLDGSSIVASNWTVGTIIGVWDGASSLHQPPAEKQIVAVVGVPRASHHGHCGSTCSWR